MVEQHKNGQKKAKIQFRTSKGLRERMDVLADRLDLSRSEFLRLLIQDFADACDFYETHGMDMPMRKLKRKMENNLIPGDT